MKLVSDRLLLTLSARTQKHQSQLHGFVENGVPDGFDVLEILQLVDDVTLAIGEILPLLEPLKPRLYSIASSQKVRLNEVWLTVGKVEYEQQGRIRKGVCSTMLAEGLKPGDQLEVFVHKNQTGFTVPADDLAP